MSAPGGTDGSHAADRTREAETGTTEGADGRGAWSRRLRALRARVPRRPKRRTVVWAAVVLAMTLLVPPGAAALALRLAYAGDLAPGTHTRDRDAIWLGHAWVDGRKDDADLAAFARRVEGTGIRELYVHTGPLERDGTLSPDKHPRSRWLVEAVHRELPGVRVHSFLGNALVYGREDGASLRLANARSRDGIVASARAVMELGFDGVHLDLEPLRSGDEDYLRLLERLGTVVHGYDGVLSVAAHQIDPLPGLHRAAQALAGRGKWWSQSYFGQVTRRVDQIALMSYDAPTPAESLYGGYVAQQTRLALEVTPQDTVLLMGLPFFHPNDLLHRAETVDAAVRGVRLGLGRGDADRERFGVALYVDFAATEEDWAAYRRGWVAPARR
ncbi:hypothetical protein [Streptomyces sp. WMMC1477]|uniref:hypothetical protein n=1 Tax=unclassified Streptomyces TaxID=2593676 RepID=UPI003FCDC783